MEVELLGSNLGISKVLVFVVVSEGIPEAERHAHIVYHISGIESLQGLRDLT